MKTIETENWTQVPDKKNVLQYQGQRVVAEVYEELESVVREKFESVAEVGFDDISLEHEHKAKEALFPKGAICVYVLPGSNEAYRVYLVVCDSKDSYTMIASCKVWSHNGAHDVCKFIYTCFYGENGKG